MATTATPYGAFVKGLGTGAFNFSTATFKVALTTASYVPNIDTDTFFSDVTDEAVGTGYTAGGQALTGTGWNYVSADTPKDAVYTATGLLWSGLTLTFRIAVLYQNTGTPTTSRLVGAVDFGVDKVVVAEDFQLNFPASVFRLKVITT